MCCVCVFSLRRESPDMILGDEPLISEVILSQKALPSIIQYLLSLFLPSLYLILHKLADPTHSILPLHLAGIVNQFTTLGDPEDDEKVVLKYLCIARPRFN
jgi:hypothetical protein